MLLPSSLPLHTKHGEEDDIASLVWTQSRHNQCCDRAGRKGTCTWPHIWPASGTVKYRTQGSFLIPSCDLQCSSHRHDVKSHVKCKKQDLQEETDPSPIVWLFWLSHKRASHNSLPTPLENPDLPCQKKKKCLRFQLFQNFRFMT